MVNCLKSSTLFIFLCVDKLWAMPNMQTSFSYRKTVGTNFLQLYHHFIDQLYRMSLKHFKFQYTLLMCLSIIDTQYTTFEQYFCKLYA